MKRLKENNRGIKRHRDGIFWALLLSMVYLFTIGTTYAILGVSLSMESSRFTLDIYM